MLHGGLLLAHELIHQPELPLIGRGVNRRKPYHDYSSTAGNVVAIGTGPWSKLFF